MQCAGRALAWELEGLGAGLGPATGWPHDARYVAFPLRWARRPKPMHQHGRPFVTGLEGIRFRQDSPAPSPHRKLPDGPSSLGLAPTAPQSP